MAIYSLRRGLMAKRVKSKSIERTGREKGNQGTSFSKSGGGPGGRSEYELRVRAPR